MTHDDHPFDHWFDYANRITIGSLRYSNRSISIPSIADMRKATFLPRGRGPSIEAEHNAAGMVRSVWFGVFVKCFLVKK